MTYRDRRERRAERREEWEAKRRAKQGAAFEGARKLSDAIPLGQPILVGHHSEKRARRDAERIQNGMRKGVEHGEMAEHHGQAADTIKRQLDESIYRDDVDELARLEEKHAKLTGERDRRKAVNVWLRKNAGMKQRIGYQVDADTWAAVCDALKRCAKALALTVDEVKEIGSAAQHSGFLGYPPYSMTNLGASIRRVEQRIPAAREKAAARAKVEAWAFAREERKTALYNALVHALRGSGKQIS